MSASLGEAPGAECEHSRAHSQHTERGRLWSRIVSRSIEVRNRQVPVQMVGAVEIAAANHEPKRVTWVDVDCCRPTIVEATGRRRAAICWSGVHQGNDIRACKDAKVGIHFKIRVISAVIVVEADRAASRCNIGECPSDVRKSGRVVSIAEGGRVGRPAGRSDRDRAWAARRPILKLSVCNEIRVGRATKQGGCQHKQNQSPHQQAPDEMNSFIS